MGIKGLSLTDVSRYVSDFDEGKNAVLVNKAEVEAYQKEASKKKPPADLKEVKPVYKHSEDATVWLLGTLDSIAMGILSDDLASITEGGGMSLRNADNDILACRMGIKGWENFTDENGNQIAFETKSEIVRGRRYDLVTEEAISAIPIPVLRELGAEIKRRNSMSAMQAKNSVSASSR